jgi:multidrug efflux system membrane fusion protein
MSNTFFRRRAIWLTGAVLIAASGAIVVGTRTPAIAADAPAAATNTPPVRVTSAAVKQQDMPIFLAGNGLVTPLYTVSVKTRIDGQLIKIGFVEGQEVKEGQMLAELDPRTLQAQLAQAQAAKAKDQAQLANARADLQRYTTLVKQDAATQQQVDTSTALVAQLSAAVQSDDAQINYAQVQLGFTRITAPISGRVGARLVDIGNIVHASDVTGLVVINRIDPITVVFSLPEEAVQEINRATRESKQPLVVHAFARNSDEEISAGTLVLVNNTIDTTTGTVQLKASFANASHVLWPGQYVNMRLTLGLRKQALTIPVAAVQRGQDGTYAYVIDNDNKAQRAPIHVAQTQDGLAVVDKGLTVGQRVVVDGQYKLRPGSQTIEPAAAGRPDGAASKGPAK